MLEPLLSLVVKNLIVGLLDERAEVVVAADAACARASNVGRKMRSKSKRIARRSSIALVMDASKRCYIKVELCNASTG